MLILKKAFPHPVKIFEQNYTKKTIYPREFFFWSTFNPFLSSVPLYRNQCIDGQLYIHI